MLTAAVQIATKKGRWTAVTATRLLTAAACTAIKKAAVINVPSQLTVAAARKVQVIAKALLIY